MYNNNLRNEVKESNRYFLDEILQTTYAYRKQMDLKIERQLNSKKQELETQLNSVFGQVIYNWKMKVRNCALKGKNFANLFATGQTVEVGRDSPLDLLILNLLIDSAFIRIIKTD